MNFEFFQIKNKIFPKINIGRPNHIYIIKNKINNKVYIGQTWQHPKERFANHLVSINKNTGCPKISNAIKSHGKDNFYLEILAICWDQISADWLEKYYIIRFDSINNGYNTIEGGRSTGLISEEHKNNISKSIFGRIGKSGEEAPFFGKKHSEDTKIKMRLAQKGKKKSKEHCENLSKAWEKREPFSEETRNKMSRSKIGISKTPEQIQKVIQAKSEIDKKKSQGREKIKNIVSNLENILPKNTGITKDELETIYRILCNSFKLVAGSRYKIKDKYSRRTVKWQMK